MVIGIYQYTSAFSIIEIVIDFDEKKKIEIETEILIQVRR
tara:strand:- start:440 stop:559 length:120 start_codon:yes stop_codon:yes gene_type:complete